MVPNPLNIVNPQAVNLTDTLGIPETRANELANKLDEMTDALSGIHYVADILKYMEEICNTQEEFVWCMINHIQWLAARGRMLSYKS